MRMFVKQVKGFTLVELAIVMTIIGLLIGGILKGQELLENARVTATMAQVKSFEAAVSTFRDIYGGLPGDLKDADTRIPGCTANCTHNLTGGGGGRVGDGFIGDKTLIEECGYVGTLTSPISSVHQEDALMWLHLLKANLISGVSDEMLKTATPNAAWGVTHPAAKVGGGFHAGSEGEPMGCYIYIDDTSGLLLSLSPFVSDSAFIDSAGTPQGVLTPVRAEQIDRKMDDGIPNKGSVFTIGEENKCYEAGTYPAYKYMGSSPTKSCSMVFSIQR